ncbi:hypothetical protein CHRYSEO8AT_30182 [Chryseobacterium sp. 8AT]|nr:hypothetical protein CHRYSEO8AT_30182 [Chryseobacterium sp. 8AT]
MVLVRLLVKLFLQNNYIFKQEYLDASTSLSMTPLKNILQNS